MKISSEQQKVIAAPGSEKILVVAGAGTGKTQVMLERLSAIAADRDNNNHGPILVLTFTRAVTGEIRKRVRKLPGAARFVQANTLNYFAHTVVRENLDEESWSSSGYDERIVLATELIQNQKSNPLRIPVDPHHIFIDEIQDLTGPRLNLVKILLGTLESGFTVMGDPAQAIYSQEHEISENEEEDIFQWLRGNFQSLSEITFHQNYRAQTEKSKTALKEGVELRKSKPEYKKIYETLFSKLCHSDLIPKFDFDLGYLPESTAILSRTNCEVLLFSELLRDLDIKHSVRLRSDERGIKPWVGRLLHGISEDTITESRYRDRIDELLQQGLDLTDSADEYWELLKKLARSKDNSFKSFELRKNIESGSHPEKLMITQHSSIELSTIHAAKGLEYETVIVAEPGDRFVYKDDYATAARLMFVAMTRTRDRLYYCKQPSQKDWSTGWLGHKSRRWSRRSPPIIQGSPTGIEFRPSDIDPGILPPHKKSGFDSMDNWYQKVCESISSDPRARLEIDSKGKVVRYRVIHNNTGMTLGFTKDEFGDLVNSMYSDQNRIPETINGLMVDGFETVVGQGDEDGKNVKVWAKPSIIGLGVWE